MIWLFPHPPPPKRIKRHRAKAFLNLGVIHTTISSVVQTSHKVKAWTGFMADVVYSCFWSYCFISQLEYSGVEYQMYDDHLPSRRRGLLTPPVISVHCLYSDFTTHKWHSEQLRAGRGTLEYWSGIHERTISSRFLGITLRVRRLEVSVYNVYITNHFQTTFAHGGGGD